MECLKATKFFKFTGRIELDIAFIEPVCKSGYLNVEKVQAAATEHKSYGLIPICVYDTGIWKEAPNPFDELEFRVCDEKYGLGRFVGRVNVYVPESFFLEKSNFTL